MGSLVMFTVEVMSKNLTGGYLVCIISSNKLCNNIVNNDDVGETQIYHKHENPKKTGKDQTYDVFTSPGTEGKDKYSSRVINLRKIIRYCITNKRLSEVKYSVT